MPVCKIIHRILVIATILIAIGCSSAGHWEGDTYIPAAETRWVYSMPDISSSICIFKDDVNIGIGIEILDTHHITSDVVFMEHKLGLSLAYRFTSILETKAGVITCYDFNEERVAVGGFLALSY